MGHYWHGQLPFTVMISFHNVRTWKTVHIYCHMSHDARKTGFPTRCDTNWPVQSLKYVRSLKFWMYVEEELYYPCSEDKGADQLYSYCTADLVSFSHDTAHIIWFYTFCRNFSVFQITKCNSQ